MMKIYAKVFPYAPKEGEESKLLARANLELGGAIMVNDVSIFRGPDGPFVSMPSFKGKDEEYVEFCHPTTKEFREAISKTVLAAYQRDSKWAVQDGNTNPSVKVSVNRSDRDGIVASGSFVLNDEFCVKGVNVRENVNGKLFVTMPSVSYEKDGERNYRDICSPAGDFEKKGIIVGSIINAAKAKLAEKEPLDAQVASAEAAKQKRVAAAAETPGKDEKKGRD